MEKCLANIKQVIEQIYANANSNSTRQSREPLVTRVLLNDIILIKEFLTTNEFKSLLYFLMHDCRIRTETLMGLNMGKANKNKVLTNWITFLEIFEFTLKQDGVITKSSHLLKLQ